MSEARAHGSVAPHVAQRIQLENAALHDAIDAAQARIAELEHDLDVERSDLEKALQLQGLAQSKFRDQRDDIARLRTDLVKYGGCTHDCERWTAGDSYEPGYFDDTKPCTCGYAAACGEGPQASRPTIVCLCGSTRFYEQFQMAYYRETMAGRIVLSVGFAPHHPGMEHGEHVGCTPEKKKALDELHMRRIDLADEVLVLNVDGYVGTSTRAEYEYAKAKGKGVRWLEGGANDS